MRRALEEAHGGIYWYTSKAEMDRTFDAAYRKIDHPMTALEFWRLAAPVVAHIKCCHTYLSFPKDVEEAQKNGAAPIFPVETCLVHYRVFGIYQYGDSGSSLVGKEILSINGVSTGKLLDELRSVFTGDGNSATAKDWHIANSTGFGIDLYGFGIQSPFRVAYRDRDGKRRLVELAGIRVPDYLKEWKKRHPEVNTNADIKFLDGGKIAAMTIRHWYHYADDAGKITFSDFLKSSFTKIHENGTSNLIIDVRGDPGGADIPVVELFGYLYDKPFHDYRDITCNATNYDFLKYDPDAKSVPQDIAKATTNGPDGKLHVIMQPGLGLQPSLQPHFGGRVFALMDGGSFSSSTEFLTLLHYYKRAKFIGEEPGGSYYGYTCGRMVAPILPHSKLSLQFGILTFYMDVSGYKYRDRGVMQDHPVSHTLDDALAGRDKDMELALSLARGR